MNEDPRADRRQPEPAPGEGEWRWDTDGGYEAFVAARARQMEKMRRESEIFRLEEAWAAPDAPDVTH